MKKKIIIIVLILIVVVGIGFSVYKQRQPKIIKVQTDKVKHLDITQIVTASGKINPQTEVKVSANVSGRIMKLGVKEGDRVKVGQFLVELDKARYEADVKQIQANMLSAKATESRTKAEFERATELFNKGLLSKADLEIANANYQNAIAVIAQTQASLDRALDALSKTTIYSPMNGVVTQLNSEEGEIVRGSEFQSDVIMIIADLSSMEVRAEVDENDIVYITKGDSARVEIDAIPDEFFKGKVIEIANSARTKGLGTQEEITNFEVKILLEKIDKRFRPGMSATVDIATETHKNVPAVLIQAITERQPIEMPPPKKGFAISFGNKKKDSRNIANRDSLEDNEPVPVVFVVENGIAKKKKVKTGISDDTYIEILEGLNGNEEVVVGSYRILSKELKDGDKVEVDNFGLKIQKKKKEKKSTEARDDMF